MGQGTPEKPVRHRDQKYHKLLKQHLAVKTLFNDPVFPAISSSVGDFVNVPPVEWKRPPDLCKSPRLIAEDVSPENVIPGKLSSPWFVSACTLLAGIGELCHKVIPEYSKQEWDPENKERYAGIFHFRFWRFGEWVDVVVDDLIPTFETEVLVTHSTQRNEYWISLVEKAYAKLHGSYEALVGGHLADALVDFTGGVSEIIDLKSEDYAGSLDKQASLLALLTTEMNNHSIVCAAIVAHDKKQEGVRTDIGLYQGHAYAVTAVKKVHLGESSLRTLFNVLRFFRGREKLAMVRLRDPHGESGMSTADTNKSGVDSVAGSEKSSGVGSRPASARDYAYSTSKLTRLLSKSPEWAKVQDSERHRIGLVCENPEEFWMPLEDFVSHFTELTICRMFNTNIFALSKTWKEASVRRTWSTGVKGTGADRAGGSSSFPDTFFRNPQYLFDINMHEEDIVIQMLQWDTTVQHQKAGVQSLLIAFYIIKVEENRKYRLHKQWDHNPTVVSFDPIRKREIYYNGHLSRGRYIIIPTTHKPGDVGGYLFRTFTTSDIHLRNIKHDVPRTRCCCCTSGYPIWVTVINIKGAENLKKFDTIGSCDAYCLINCERKSVQTFVARNTTDPSWNSAFVFYRCKMDAPIVIKVYNHNTLMPDNFAGQVQLPAPVNQHPTLLHAELLAKGTNDPQRTQGTLVLEVYTNDNFMTV